MLHSSSSAELSASLAFSANLASSDCSRSRVEGRSSVRVRMRWAGAAAGRQTAADPARRAAARQTWRARSVQPKQPQQRQRRQAAPQRSRWRGRAHRRMRAKRSSVHGQGARDIRRERRMLCVSARSVALLGLRRPEQREQLQCPVRLHPCDQSARWRRKWRVRGEQGAGTGAPASLVEQLPRQREAPPLLTVFPTAKGMRPRGQRKSSPRPEQG
jgi:hypothetical protein